LFATLAVGVGIVLAAAVAEIALRLAHFTPGQVNSGYLQFGYQSGIPTFDEDGVRGHGPPVRVRLFQPDPEVLWVPIPDTELTNSQGFRGRTEFDETKTPETLRVLFIGDSCTFLGDPVYPEIVQQQLAQQFPGRRVECINASSPGYSSFQGAKLLQRLRRWQPDAVVVYFGWNDHWPAQGGLTDQLQYSLGHDLRILGLIRAVRAQRSQEPTNRVPLDDFAANLAAMRDTIASWKALPLFITAPTGFRRAAMPPKSYPFFEQVYHMDKAAVDSIPEQHQTYADAVRRVAATPPAVLVDAAADFAASGLSAIQVFRKDQIHLRAPGHERVAKLVSEALAAHLQQ
jgi:lysophospholipase L1-like esterase